jgi:large subunit ribosomal protein L14e
MEIQAGSIVYSKAGRDKTKILLVLSVSDGYAYVADGELRTVDRLKKKKLKHLQKTNQISEINKDCITNSDIRKILAQYKPNN